MPPVKLDTKYVEKPWGRTEIPDIFPNPGRRQIGEIWFDGPEGKHPPLLVKYIFTSEKLSVQVHPNDAEAKERGLPGGKSECWYILDATPDATLGMGTHVALDEEHLRDASLDGSIEKLMDWKPVKAGDFFYIPAGTVHAIGPGLTLIEVQQNNDVTYRLYDYGRPRELHLEDGVEVSKAKPYPDPERNIPLAARKFWSRRGARRSSWNWSAGPQAASICCPPAKAGSSLSADAASWTARPGTAASAGWPIMAGPCVPWRPRRR